MFCDQHKMMSALMYTRCGRVFVTSCLGIGIGWPLIWCLFNPPPPPSEQLPHNLTHLSPFVAGFLCWLEPHLYGVCEWRILPGTAPHLRGEVNRPPPEGLRYPETSLIPSTQQTADSSKGPLLGYCVVLGPTALPCPNQYENLLSTFSLNSQSQTALLNGVNWLDDSWIVSPSFFFFLLF